MTGKTVEEAKEQALDALGVDESEAEFDVLEEAKGGLFGLLRSEARVRARVLRTAVRPKSDDRPNRRRGGGQGGRSRGGAGNGGRGERAAASHTQDAEGDGRRAAPARSKTGKQKESVMSEQEPASEGAQAQGERPGQDAGSATGAGSARVGIDEDAVEVAEDFLDGLLDVFGLDYDLERRDVDDDTVELAITGSDLGLLIGHRGQTLAALQELTRTAVQRSGSSQRVYIDVAGYREARREALQRFTQEVAGQVVRSGAATVLDPMPAADRKVVHDTANGIEGVSTSSEGEEPRRRVVISPS